MNLVRIIEMRAGEIFQVRSGWGNDYLLVLEGSLEIARDGAVHSLSGPDSSPAKATVLPREAASTTLLAREDSIRY
jgi:hypothetical protein